MTDTQRPIDTMIWLDGFNSGIASALRTSNPDMPDELIDALTDRWANDLQNDPAGMYEVTNQIAERLAGADTGPFNLNVPAKKDGN